MPFHSLDQLIITQLEEAFALYPEFQDKYTEVFNVLNGTSSISTTDSQDTSPAPASANGNEPPSTPEEPPTDQNQELENSSSDSNSGSNSNSGFSSATSSRLFRSDVSTQVIQLLNDVSTQRPQAGNFLSTFRPRIQRRQNEDHLSFISRFKNFLGSSMTFNQYSSLPCHVLGYILSASHINNYYVDNFFPEIEGKLRDMTTKNEVYQWFESNESLILQHTRPESFRNNRFKGSRFSKNKGRYSKQNGGADEAEGNTYDADQSAPKDTHKDTSKETSKDTPKDTLQDTPQDTPKDTQVSTEPNNTSKEILSENNNSKGKEDTEPRESKDSNENQAKELKEAKPVPPQANYNAEDNSRPHPNQSWNQAVGKQQGFEPRAPVFHMPPQQPRASYSNPPPVPNAGPTNGNTQPENAVNVSMEAQEQPERPRQPQPQQSRFQDRNNNRPRRGRRNGNFGNNNKQN